MAARLDALAARERILRHAGVEVTKAAVVRAGGVGGWAVAVTLPGNPDIEARRALEEAARDVPVRYHE